MIFFTFKVICSSINNSFF